MYTAAGDACGKTRQGRQPTDKAGTVGRLLVVYGNEGEQPNVEARTDDQRDSAASIITGKGS